MAGPFQPGAFQGDPWIGQMDSGAGQITTGQSFGVPDPNRIIRNTGAIATAELFGTTRVFTRWAWVKNGIATAEAFGVARLIRQLAETSFGSGETFGTTGVPRRLGPSGAVTGQALGAPRAMRNLAPTGLVSLTQFGNGKTIRYVQPGGVVSGEAFEAKTAIVTIITGVYQITGVGQIGSGEAFGIDRLLRLLAAQGVTTGNVFGTARPTRQLNATGVTSAAALGSPKTFRRLAHLGLTTSEAFGTSKALRIIQTQPVTTGQAFGILRTMRQLATAGTASQEQVGQAVRLLRLLQQTGISPAEAFGIPAFPDFIPPETLIQLLTDLLVGQDVLAAVTLLDDQLAGMWAQAVDLDTVTAAAGDLVGAQVAAGDLWTVLAGDQLVADVTETDATADI